ncbi:MAG: glutamate 5-kinase [Promicromonosporaceae bacterium]|nr:glutamate 5-kinase [Promicromonosporaceae bacterium]
MTSPEQSNRALITGARRVVVKVGSSSLTDAEGHLDTAALRKLVSALVNWLAANPTQHQLVLVTSGAVAAGLQPLGFEKRPEDLASIQAAASVGQSHLIAEYSTAFAQQGITVAQILLTAGDTVRRRRYENAKRTLNRLLDLGVVPIINENDTVTVAELKFGDNDRLAALAALLVRADALVLLTDIDGLYDKPPHEPGAELISYVSDFRNLADITVTTSGSKVGTGGMVTKLNSARIAATSGIPVMLAHADSAALALAGDPVGTLFAPTSRRSSGRMHWLAHAAGVRGELLIDDGAAHALRETGASLLAVGVVSMSGEFAAGDPIQVNDSAGNPVARGLAAFDSVEIPQLLGRSSKWLRAALGERYDRPVIHRDDLVLITH